MATRDEIVDKAAALSSDKNNTQVSPDDKVSLLNTIYKDVVKRFFAKSNDFYLASATISYAAAATSAEFPPNARETVEALYNNDRILTLQQKPFNPSTTGPPLFYKIVGKNIEITPTPNEAITLTLLYYRTVVDMQTPTSEPDIPNGEENSLIYALAAAVWLQKGEKMLRKDFDEMSQKVIDEWEPGEGGEAQTLTTDLHNEGNAAVPHREYLLYNGSG